MVVLVSRGGEALLEEAPVEEGAGGVEDLRDLEDVLRDSHAVEGEVVACGDLGEEVFDVGGEGEYPLGVLTEHGEGADAGGGVLVFVCRGDESY